MPHPEPQYCGSDTVRVQCYSDTKLCPEYGGGVGKPRKNKLRPKIADNTKQRLQHYNSVAEMKTDILPLYIPYTEPLVVAYCIYKDSI